MKAEYDFSKGRRGVKRTLPPRSELAKRSKVRITIMLDADVLAAFKAEAERPGSTPYQTRINQVLRAHVAGTSEPADALVEDPRFIERIAERVAAYHRKHPSTPARRSGRR